jgi:hypothetical protein
LTLAASNQRGNLIPLAAGAISRFLPNLLLSSFSSSPLLFAIEVDLFYYAMLLCILCLPPLVAVDYTVFLSTYVHPLQKIRPLPLRVAGIRTFTANEIVVAEGVNVLPTGKCNVDISLAPWTPCNHHYH